MKYIIEKRTQRAAGTWPKKGPDAYVAVQIVPDDVEPLKVLRRDSARKRGIELIHCGEFYSNRTGPRSMYGVAMRGADIVLGNEIDKILLEDKDSLLVNFGEWENKGTHYLDADGEKQYSTDSATPEEIQKALYLARYSCRDYANDENNGVITDQLVRTVRGSL